MPRRNLATTPCNMAFSFSKAKSLVRRIVHKTFGVPAFYKDSSLSKPVEMSARWHSKIERVGDLDNQGFAEIIQGIDRVIFDVAEARQIGIRRNGEISFPELSSGLGVSLGGVLGGEGSGPPAFILNSREECSGPNEEIWLVTRKEIV